MININLIADRERARRLGEIAGRVAFFAAVGAFITTMATISWQQSRLRSLKATNEMAQATVAKLQRQKSQIDAVQQELDSKRPLVDLLRSARDSEAKWCAALADISRSLPAGVSLAAVRSSSSLRPRVTDAAPGKKPGMAKEREGFTLSGQADSSNLVGQFIARLQNTPSFKDVYMQYTRKTGGGLVKEAYDFEIQALLPGKEKTP